MYESKFLRWKMEEVWKTGGCVCPNHITIWFDSETGWGFYDKEMRYILLWYRQGRRLSPRRKKTKGKGYSFLSKFYGLTWRCRDEKDIERRSEG